MNGRIELAPGVLAATEALGASLGRAEPVMALRKEKVRLDADERANALLKQMAEIDADLRRRQTEGTLTRQNIDRARQAHFEASSDPSIQRFTDARQAALAYLPEVNEMISELLGWDFAQMAAAPATC
jgi:cell fate (sporulation/competence/biofilm development) regulator YlbF (YheA/YmcA/DUF963 family)